MYVLHQIKCKENNVTDLAKSQKTVSVFGYTVLPKNRLFWQASQSALWHACSMWALARGSGM